MEFSELTQQRRSTRLFEMTDVSDAYLKRIITVAERAPSAANLQSYRVVVVREPPHRERLCEAAGDQRAIAYAPVALVFLADVAAATERFGKRGRHYAIVDASLAAAYAQLAVHDLGLATVWIGDLDEERVRMAVHAENGFVPVCILPIGHASEHPEPAGRLPLYDIAKLERLDGPSW